MVPRERRREGGGEWNRRGTLRGWDRGGRSGAIKGSCQA